MALQTDPTVAGLEAYADVVYADNYLSKSRLYTDKWEVTPKDTKERALAWAASLLNNLPYKGSKANVDEVLEWPRSGVTKSRDSYELYLNTEIPTTVKQANCELAMHLLEKDRTTLYEENLGLSSLSVSGINLNFDHSKKEDVIPNYINSMLKSFTVSGRMLRG